MIKKTAFVVGPIGDLGSDLRTHADWLFEYIIEPVLTETGQFDSPIRADKISQPGLIDAQIIRQLLEADIVIADLSFLNANAFYEIGIRHMAQKPIVHMQLVGDKIPFDVSLYRAVKFSLRHPNDIAQARSDLKASLEQVIAEGHRIENPVTNARGQIQVNESATPEIRTLLNQMEALNSRVDLVERQSGILPPLSASGQGPFRRVRASITLDWAHYSDPAKRKQYISLLEQHAVLVAQSLGFIIKGYAKTDSGLDLQFDADRTHQAMLALFRKRVEDFGGVQHILIEMSEEY